MLLCMRTTIDLADGLFIEAKKRAIEERITLRALVESCLRAYLSPKPEVALAQDVPPKKIRIDWPVVEGGLPVGLNVQSREDMHEWLTKESAK